MCLLISKHFYVPNPFCTVGKFSRVFSRCWHFFHACRWGVFESTEVSVLPIFYKFEINVSSYKTSEIILLSISCFKPSIYCSSIYYVLTLDKGSRLHRIAMFWKVFSVLKSVQCLVQKWVWYDLGRGPDSQVRKKRQVADNVRRANQLGQDIVDHGDVFASSSTQPDPSFPTTGSTEC